MRRCAVLLLAVIPLAGGCQQKMQDFVSTDHKFKVKFPGKPKQEERTTLGVQMTVYSVASRDGIYGVAVADIPDGGQLSPADIRRALDGGEEGVLANVNGTRKSSSDITLAGKYPGREVSGTMTTPREGAIRSRMYLVGSRMYEVTVAGYESYTNSARSTEFLNSFQVIE